MPVFYEVTNTDDAMPVEVAAPLSSASLASGATTSAFSLDGYITVTATEDGYIDIGPSPNSAADPRRRVLNGVMRSFRISKGDKLMFTAG